MTGFEGETSGGRPRGEEGAQEVNGQEVNKEA